MKLAVAFRDKGYNLQQEEQKKFLEENGVESTFVAWPDYKNAELKVNEMIAEKRFDLIINIPKNLTERELTNGYMIR